MKTTADFRRENNPELFDSLQGAYARLDDAADVAYNAWRTKVDAYHDTIDMNHLDIKPGQVVVYVSWECHYDFDRPNYSYEKMVVASTDTHISFTCGWGPVEGTGHIIHLDVANKLNLFINVDRTDR